MLSPSVGGGPNWGGGAYDRTGTLLWKVDLPAAGVGVPVTYDSSGEQYLVIPAGGHSMYGTTMGDSVVAYKLGR